MRQSPEIGTRRWWFGEALWGPRQVIDTILRLLEQGEISRMKAGELVRFATCGRADTRSTDIPDAPWDKLNWNTDA